MAGKLTEAELSLIGKASISLEDVVNALYLVCHKHTCSDCPLDRDPYPPKLCVLNVVENAKEDVEVLKRVTQSDDYYDVEVASYRHGQCPYLVRLTKSEKGDFGEVLDEWDQCLFTGKECDQDILDCPRL